jgi:hypothetical protein
MPDTITAVMAIAAFILSLVNSYFQFLRKVSSVHFSLLDLWMSGGEDEQGVGMRFVIANEGNAPATISQIALVIPFERSAISGDRSWRDPESGQRQEPITIAPGGQREHRVTFPFSKETIDRMKPDTADRHSTTVSVVVVILDRRGKRFERKVQNFSVETQHHRITSIGTGPDRIVRLLPVPRAERAARYLVAP